MDSDIYNTDVSHFTGIIGNYEILTTELVHELHTIKSEHDNLKQNVCKVIEENKKLTHDLNEQLSLQENIHPPKAPDLTDNLKEQISALSQERDHAIKLWQNSMSSINILEDELKIYQSGTQNFIPKGDVHKMKQSYEDQIKYLEKQMSTIQIKLEDKLQTSTKELNTKNQEIDKALETQTSAFKIVKNLEDEVLALQNRLQDLEKSNKKLQKTVKDKDEYINNIMRKNLEYREKMGEALQIVEAALNEKDAAIFREKEARDEISRINHDITEIIRETEEKIKHEVTAAKLESSRRFEDLHKTLQDCKEELKIKTLEVEKLSTKCVFLEQEIEKFRKGNYDFSESNISKLLVLEKNLESTFQKLLVSEKLNIQLVSEKETMKNDIEQMAGHYERTLKTKEIEKVSFLNRIKQFETQLEEERSILSNIKQQFDCLNEEKVILEKNFEAEKQEIERNLSKNFSNRMEEEIKSHNDKLRDLQIQLEVKDKVNKKWSTETKTIVENLEKFISDLKSEIHRLKKDNKKLLAQLKESRSKFEQCKGYLEIISKDVNKMNYIAMSDKDLQR